MLLERVKVEARSYMPTLYLLWNAIEINPVFIAYSSYSRSDPKSTPDPNKKLFLPQHYIILIPLIRNSAFDYTNQFPFLEFKNNI